ncbi:MAG: GntR family transcriptional regulator [Eubacterium sp.]|jgi:DNA-binding GntR family transcriptional regulator|nr:GntR family transcriptional regulator [Eubacterium sp.]
MDNLELNANAYLPLRDVVFHTLREAILKGDLKPGERLMELQLAAKLGVSRTPIREAIRMLQQEGLAITVPRKGAEVAGIEQKDMEDVLQIREALEILAVQLACDNISAAQIEDLEKNVAEFEEVVKTKDIKSIAESDIAFHDIIFEAASNPRLVMILNNLRGQIYRYRMEYLKKEEMHPCLVGEHKQIAEGLKRRDKAYVMEMTQKHVKNQEKAIKNIISEQE